VAQKMIFIDSSIWCYYFDKRLPEHQLIREPIRQILLSSEELASNTIVVMEIAHYLVRHFSEKDARKKIEHFVNLRNMKIFGLDTKLMSESLDYLLNYGYSEGLGGRDATILAAMNSQSIKTLVSHDDAFKRLAEKMTFKIIDPVRTL
jgi:predicted nucleic acid-binding protein